MWNLSNTCNPLIDIENHLFYRYIELAKNFILSFLEKDFTEKPKWTFGQPSIDICNQTYKALYGSTCFIVLYL